MTESACNSPARSLGDPSSLTDSDLEMDTSQVLEVTVTEVPTTPDQTIVDGWVKFRDNKRWKQRWGVVTKLSPAADCLHLQLYRDSKDRYKQGQTKASLSLQHFLGVETGFTLDKESNTIAIICQDVTVILAFDTRERLIQWQVKISTNLGEDQQFLIQISSAPPKSKIATGPARLHVAPDLKFCITTGVPPRLAGYWDIAHLRRYGVVEGRFCFEGGSRCGRGEGLHVCVTDQGDEIIAAFQGKVGRNRRPVSRKLSAMTESPRKTDQLSRSMYSDAPQACCSGSELDPASRHHSNEDLLCPCRAHSSSSPFWSSAESASGLHHLASSSDLDSNYGCGDTASVTGIPDHFHHQDPVWAHDPGRPAGGTGGGTSSLERCASCISKLGAPSMSRSSTVTTTNTPTGAPASFSPAWTMDMVPPHHHSNCDRMSLSSHSSSGGNSEYSVPRFATPAPDWYDRPRMTPPSVPPKSPKMPPGLSLEQAAACHCQCCPPMRPPKPPQMSSTDSPSKRKVKKPPMPLPTVEPTPNPCMCRQLTVGPYENYDVPKSLLGNSFQKDDSKVVAPAEDYYDTPKNMKECLAMDYGNYDTPAPLSGMMLRKPCGCVVKYTRKEPVKTQPQQEELDATRATDCPCQRVMCWATGMMMLPYCRRGHGVENTGLPIHKVKLSGEGKMPVMNPCGEIAIYATVDKSKKTNRKQPVPCNCNPEDKHKDDCPNHETSKGGAATIDGSNYVNIEPDGSLSANSSQQPVDNNANTSTAGLDYENIEFAQSLEYYENSKDLLQKVVGLTKSHGNDSEATQIEVEDTTAAVSYTINNGIKFCKKCGHACHMLSPSQVETVGESEEQQDNCQDDYLMMEPAKNVKPTLVEGKHPGYLPMSPITAQQQQQCGAKLSDKSASIPSLLDRSRRIPGSAMMMMMHHHNSYLRRVLHDEDGRKSSHLHPSSRRRSSSADSSRYLDDLEDLSENTIVSSREISSSHTELSAPEVTAKEPAKTEEAENRLNCEEIVESNEQGKEDGTSTSSESGSLRTLVRESLAETAPPQQEPLPSSSSSSSAVHIRRSSSVPCKSGNNRDSSSSNDSGVSIGSLRHRGADFAEFELPLTTAMSTRRHHHAVQGRGLHHGNYYHIGSGALGGPSGMNCLHASLPRRSKSVDPLREISFQFQKDKIPAKSSSAEAEVPVCTAKRDPAKGYASPGGEGNAIVMPYMDSRSTSSGTSDMSDYIETLSLSSHSSQSDNTADSLRLGRSATTTLRPRSGKEYQLIDRTILEGEFKELTGRGEGSP